MVKNIALAIALLLDLGSVYLDRGAGLFQTLDTLTAEAASHVPCAGGQTIAAHCAHLAYYTAYHLGAVRHALKNLGQRR
jgi:hypothetical protein